MPERVSIVIPALDEAGGIASQLCSLQPLRGPDCEIIVVDGGSVDGTVAIAQGLADRVLEAPRGRAVQMNFGATAASGDIILFLHADTRLPDGALDAVRAALAGKRGVWGRFDVDIAGRHPLLRVVSWFVNQRSRLTGIATGDQAIFVRREAFLEAGGFPAIPLMEDVALSKALRRGARPACLRARVVTSGRRWESRGVVRTILLMWLLRFAYWLGCDPACLARRYA